MNHLEPVRGFRFASNEDHLLARDEQSGRVVRLLHVSPAEVAFKLVEGPPLRTGDRLTLRLGAIAPFAVVVVDLRDQLAVAELPGVTIDTGRALASVVRRLMAFRAGLLEDDLVLERDQIDNPERIREILRALFANRRPGRLRRLDGVDGKGIRIQPARLVPESPTPLQWEAEAPWFRPPFVAEIDGYISRYRFVVEQAHTVDGFLAAKLPATLERVRNRTQRRVPAPENVMLSFRHPRWPELRIERPVRNVSLNGLSFSTSVFKDLVYPGLRVDDATVVWQDRLACRMHLQIRHVSEDIDTAAELAGAQVSFENADDAAHWHGRLDALLYPDTSADGTWSRQLWDLFRDSGYFNLSQKKEQDFAAARQAFETSGRKLAAAEHLGSRIVWPSSRGVEASMSILRIYHSATVFFQLARRQGRTPMRFPGRKILRDLYLYGIERVQENPLLRWLIVWVQEDARFGRLVHHALASRYLETGRSEVSRFRALEGFCDVKPANAPADLELAPASPKEIEELLAVVARTRSATYAEAHDLVPARYSQAELKRAWAEAGLVRDRQTLVARKKGKALAAAVLEYADDGLHLFGLLDLVRLFPLAEGGEASYTPLLETAREWYRQRRKRNFVYFLEGADLEHAHGARLHDLGAADMSLFPVSLLPELMEHLFEVTCPRDMPPWPTTR